MGVSNDCRESDPGEKSCLYLRNEETQGVPKKQVNSVVMTNLLIRAQPDVLSDNKVALPPQEIQR